MAARLSSSEASRNVFARASNEPRLALKSLLISVFRSSDAFGFISTAFHVGISLVHGRGAGVVHAPNVGF